MFFRTLFATLIACCVGMATLNAQHSVVNSLTFSSGPYLYTLQAPPLTGNVVASLASTANTWALGGNVINEPAGANNRIGTLNSLPILFIAGGEDSVRLTIEATGRLVSLTAHHSLRFVSAEARSVTISPPDTLGASYALSLPSTPPGPNQVLRTGATDSTQLEWGSTSSSGFDPNDIRFAIRATPDFHNTTDWHLVVETNLDANTSYLLESLFRLNTPNVTAEPVFRIVVPTGSTIQYGWNSYFGPKDPNIFTAHGFTSAIDTEFRVNVGAYVNPFIIAVGKIVVGPTPGNVRIEYRRMGDVENIYTNPGAYIKATPLPN